MFHILWGPDTFSAHEALEKIKRGLGDPQALATNTMVFDGQKLTLAELTAACDTVPFLADRRLAIVEGLLGRFQPQRGAPQPRRTAALEKQLADWLALKDYVKTMPPSTVLVMKDGELGKDNRLLQGLSQVAEVKGFPELRRDEIQRWIGERVAKLGVAISPQAVRLLAEQIGGNLWVISMELDKLCLYARGRCIEEADVRLLAGSVHESNIFVLIDAVVGQRRAQAFQVLEQLLWQGAAPPYVLVMLTSQFRLILQAVELKARGLSPRDIAGRLGIAHEYRLKKVLEQTPLYSPKRLEHIYCRLLETDISIKTGRQDGELALELLITELSSA